MTTTTYSKSEKGHFKNLQNFDELIQVCTRYGVSYNPSATNLTLVSLQAKYDECKAAQDMVNPTHSTYTHKVNDRQVLFEKMPKLTTRILQSLLAHTNDKKLLADAKTYANKIHGRPPKVKTNDNREGQETTSSHSNSQRSYDKLLDHFDKIILLLENVPAYTPNETELSVTGLRAYYTELKNADKSQQASQIFYKQALTNRDHQFYNEDSGLIIIAKLAKNYVKSVFGLKSLEYAELKKLDFTSIIRK